MGVWGTKPWENDTAADFCCDLGKIPVTELIDKGLNSDDEDEQRIAAWLLSRLAVYYVYPYETQEKQVKRAIRKLNDMLKSDWIEAWNNPNEVIGLIRHEVIALEEV